MIVLFISLWVQGLMKYIGYALAVIVYDLSIALILSDLSMEAYTNYYILEIYHPIAIETKLTYLNDELVYCYSQLTDILSKYSPDELRCIANHIETSLNLHYFFTRIVIRLIKSSYN